MKSYSENNTRIVFFIQHQQVKQVLLNYANEQALQYKCNWYK